MAAALDLLIGMPSQEAKAWHKHDIGIHRFGSCKWMADLKEAVHQGRLAALDHDVPNVDLHVPAENMDPNCPGPCIGDCLLE